MQEAKRRDLRVITELVVNHTSDQHDWFKRAKRSGRGTQRAQLVCVERQRPQICRHPHHLHRHREVELDLGRRGRRLLLAPLLLAPARPELRQSARGQGGAAGDEALARHRRGRVPPRRRALSVRARGHQQREPAGDPRRAQALARRARRLRARQGAAGRGQPMAGGRAGLFRRRRRMPHGLSLPADAAHLHGDRAGRPLPDHRHHAADAGNPGQLPVGHVPAQSRRADAGNGDRLASATICGRPTPPIRARASISASAGAWRR